MTNRPPTKNSKGFALIEVMMATLLLTVGCLAFLKLQRVGLQYSFYDYARSQGVAIAQGFAEKLRGNLALVREDTFSGSVKSSDAVPATVDLPQTNADCTNANPSTACAKAMLTYQSYLTAQQMKHLIKGNSVLCYSRNADSRGLVRLTFMWVDNTSRNTTIICPTSFAENDTIENAVTIYAQL